METASAIEEAFISLVATRNRLEGRIGAEGESDYLIRRAVKGINRQLQKIACDLVAEGADSHSMLALLNEGAKRAKTSEDEANVGIA